MRHVAAPARSQRRLATLLLLVGVTAAVLVSIVIGFSTGLLSWREDGGAAGPEVITSGAASSSVKPSGAPASVPAGPSPADDADAGELFPQSIARVVIDGTEIRQLPGADSETLARLDSGTYVYLDGYPDGQQPAAVDDAVWYEVFYVPGAATWPPLLSDKAVRGWVANPDGLPPAIVHAPQPCPESPNTVAELASVPPYDLLRCFGSRPLSVTGSILLGGIGGDPGASFEPVWLAHPFAADGGVVGLPGGYRQLVLKADPESRVSLSGFADGASVAITARMDDPASLTCTVTAGSPLMLDAPSVPWPLAPTADEWIVTWCREQLVTTSIVPAGTPAPTAEPAAVDAFPPLAMVRAMNPGILLRAEPGLWGERLGSLAEGSRSLVVDGPVRADGLDWYRLSGPGLPPASGCITPGPTEPFECPIWYGWAATGPTHDWFVLDPTECPDPEADLYAFALLGDYEALSCASERELKLTGWLRAYATTPEYERCPTRGDPDAPDWLLCHDRWWEALYADPDEAVFIDLYVDPASGIVLPHDGRWVTVAGHVDDSRAAACGNSIAIGHPIAPDWAALECRAHFVVTGIRDAAEP